MTKLTPTPEQIEDAAKMAQGDLGNFSAPGTGKTLTTITAFDKVGYGGLIVAPTIALSMWERELKRQLDAEVQVIRSSKTRIDMSVDFHVTSYKLMTLEAGHYLRSRYSADPARNRAMAMDEAHRAKNLDAKVTQALYGDTLEQTGGTAQYFDNVWPLTGTPMTKYHDDLWPMLSTLWPHVLHQYNCTSYEDFMASFTWREWRTYPGMRQERYVPVSSIGMEIMNRILYEDIGCIRRTFVPGLPSVRTEQHSVKLEAPAWIDVLPDEIKLLRKMGESDALAQLIRDDGKGDAPLSSLRRCMGMMNIKNSLEFIIDAALAGPVLVGIVHKDVSTITRQRLQAAGLRVEEINGSTHWKARDDIEARFNAGEVDVLLGQIHACGEVLNLQGASCHVIILEDDYTPSVITQFYKRVARRGQVKSCMVDFLTPACGLGAALVATRARKSAEHRITLGDDDA